MREIRARRNRRERIRNFGGEGGDEDREEGVKRMARRLLVANLKKRKELELAEDRLDRGKKVKASFNIVQKARKRGRTGAGTGAFAPGFHLGKGKDTTSGDSEEAPQENVDIDLTTISDTGSDAANGAKSCTDLIAETTEYLDTIAHRHEKNNFRNDWDDAVVVLDGSQQSTSNTSDDDKNSLKKKLKTKISHENINTASLLTLSSYERKGAIEKVRRDQRMQSRRECMSVAANPDEYSQAQVRNFLKSSNLNKKINEVGTKAANNQGSGGCHHNLKGERIASDASRRIIFVKDGDEGGRGGAGDNKVEKKTKILGQDIQESTQSLHIPLLSPAKKKLSI